MKFIAGWLGRGNKLAYAGYVDIHGNQNGACGLKWFPSAESIWKCKSQLAEEFKIVYIILDLMPV